MKAASHDISLGAPSSMHTTPPAPSAWPLSKSKSLNYDSLPLHDPTMASFGRQNIASGRRVTIRVCFSKIAHSVNAKPGKARGKQATGSGHGSYTRDNKGKDAGNRKDKKSTVEEKVSESK